MSKEVLENIHDSMASATHGVWLDQDVLTGDGLIVHIAPELFQMGADGLEYTRFGRALGLRGGAEALVPIVPELMDKAIHAAEEHPGESVYIDELRQPPEQSWNEFFRGAITWARSRIHYHLGESLETPLFGFFDGTQRNIPVDGVLQACAALVDPDPIDQAKIDQLYDTYHGETELTPLDQIDVLSYVGAPYAADVATRRDVASSLYRLAETVKLDYSCNFRVGEPIDWLAVSAVRVDRPELAKAAMHFLTLDT